MEIQRFTYLGLLILTMAYPLAKSFEPRIQFYKKLKYILPAIVITAIPFLIWDVFFEQYHIWQFNPEYTIGMNILGLPIEEWLFFFIIPYSCFFIYEVINYFTGNKNIPHIKAITILLALILLIIGLTYNQLDYTFVNFVFAAIILFAIVYIKQIYIRLTSYFKGYLVSLLPFFLINGVLTKIPVVSYNNRENLSLRIYTIPVEDMVYLLSLLFINFALYETIKYYAGRKTPSHNRNR